MPNDIFRDRVNNLIQSAIKEALNVKKIEHPFLQGRIREIVLDNIFKPLLILGTECGTGKIVDSKGIQSDETDIIIYSKNILPSIMYSEREGIFPAESCLYSIEVKSKSTAEEVKDAIKKAKKIRELHYLSGEYDNNFNPVENLSIQLIAPVFFAFDSDLKNDRKSEIDRYKENDPDFYKYPYLRAICVVGKGYWWFNFNKKEWVFHPPTEFYDEVIDFLSGIINSLPNILTSRKYPRVGSYLILDRETKIIKKNALA